MSGTEFQVNSYTANAQYSPSVIALSTSHFLVTWSSKEQDGSGSGIYGKILFNKIIVFGINVTRTYIEDTPYSFSQLPLDIELYYQPRVYVQLTLPNGVGRLSTSKQGGVAPIFSNKTGIWQASGVLADMNTVLERLNFIPSKNYDKPFTINVHVSDALGVSPDLNVFMQFSAIPVNDEPILVNNNLLIRPGMQLTITSQQLSAMDVDNSERTLVFNFTNLKHIHFERTDIRGEHLTQFNQRVIQDRKIRVIHDGTNALPSGEVTVSDGIKTTKNVPLNIRFETNKKFTLPLVLSLTGISVVGLGIGIGFWRHRVNKRKAEQRSKHLLADRIYSKLNVKC